MKEALGPAFNEFIRSTAPPCAIAPEQNLKALYQVLKDYEGRSERECKGAFFFGGLFTSIAHDETPNDYDVVICNPEIVRLAKKVTELNAYKPESQREWNERSSDIDHYMAKIKPYSDRVFYNDENMREVRHSNWLGDFFQITASIYSDEISSILDITFCENDVDRIKLLSLLTDAPIRSIGYDPDSSEYTYHKDFEDHMSRWRFEPFSQKEPRAHALEKAKHKGMQIIL